MSEYETFYETIDINHLEFIFSMSNCIF